MMDINNLLFDVSFCINLILYLEDLVNYAR